MVECLRLFGILTRPRPEAEVLKSSVCSFVADRAKVKSRPLQPLHAENLLVDVDKPYASRDLIVRALDPLRTQ